MANTDEGSTDMANMDERARAVHDTFHQDSTNSGPSFWRILQEENGVEIPIYIKNILTLSNLDNPLSFQCITDDTIKELEAFARENMRDFLKRGDNLEFYFGRYHRMPDKFRFLIGDRLMIKELVTFVKIQSKDYWKMGTLQHFGQSLSYSINPDIELDERDQQLLLNWPPDPTMEQEELATQVRKVLTTEDLGCKVDLQALLTKVDVQVKVKSMFDKQRQQEYYVSQGTIKCVLCSGKLTIRKNSIAGAKRSRWITSNFRRHIRFHREGKLKGMPLTHVTSSNETQKTVVAKEEEEDEEEEEEMQDVDQVAGDEESVDEDRMTGSYVVSSW